MKPFTNQATKAVGWRGSRDRATPFTPLFTETLKNSTKPRLEGIQGCRGIAALLVLLFHLTQLSQEKLGQPFFANVFAFGSAGVDFFFVLSGFIIFFVHHTDLGKRDRLKPFVIKRLLRIYPLYWLITLAILPIYFLAPQFGYGYERDFTVIFKSLLLVPQQHFPILIVGWSLSHELLFYLIFALAIFLPLKVSRYLFSGWLLGTIVVFCGNLSGNLSLEKHSFIQFMFNAHNLEFLLGCIAAFLASKIHLKAQKSLSISEKFYSKQGVLLATDLAADLATDEADKLFTKSHLPRMRDASVSSVPIRCSPNIRQREIALFFTALGTSLFLSSGAVQAGRSLNPILAYGIPSAFIVLGTASLDLQRSRPLPRLLSYLGDASYSIYLTHYLCLSLLIKLVSITQISSLIEQSAMMHLVLPTIFISITLGMGCLTYAWLEKPMVNHLRHIFFKGKPVTAKPVIPKTMKDTSGIQPHGTVTQTNAMSILFLDQSGALAGAELCLLDLVQPYRDRCLVCLFTDGPFQAALQQQRVPVQVLATQPIQVRKESGLVQGLQSLGQLLPLAIKVAQLSRSYDLIYANTQKALVVGALASFLSRRPLVYHLHDILSIDHFSRTNRRLAVTLANRVARQVIATSNASRNAFIQAGGRTDITTVVYNGFEPAMYQKPVVDITQFRQQLGIEGQFVIGHFSRLSPWKGQHILLEALVDCPADVAAIFVGDALFGEQGYVQTLKAQVKALGLQNRVHFLGFRSDVVPLLYACDLVAHTSTAPEPFGRVIAEAMFCGRPIIAAASGGAVELVEPGITGWLIPPGDVKALATTIAHCRNHPEQVTAIAQTAQTTAIQRFALDRIRQQIDQVLRKAVGC